MDAYEICGIYLAVKLHFKEEKYNFKNSSGSIFIKPETFQKRKDRFMFHKISKKYSDDQILPLLISNFIINDKCWTGDLISAEGERNYLNWRKVTESMTHFYKEDLEKHFKDKEQFISLFNVPQGEYPKLLTELLEGNILIETMVILNNIFGYIQKWDSSIDDTIIYPKISRKIRKYGSFLEIDVSKYRKITKEILES